VIPDYPDAVPVYTGNSAPTYLLYTSQPKYKAASEKVYIDCGFTTRLYGKTPE